MNNIDYGKEIDEFEIEQQLRCERKDIKSFDDLIRFLSKVKDNYNYGYGVQPRAIAQAALATANFLASEFGITGFQAGFVMWGFIRDWRYYNNKCGLKIVDYDLMLYPQYQNEFEKTISKETFEELQKQVQEALNKPAYAHPNVIRHWTSIVNGNVPFGYCVKE